MANGHLLQRDNLGLLDKLVAKVQTKEDGDVNVRRDEGLGAPVVVDEGGVAARQQQDDEADQRGPGQVGLEGRLPGKLVARDALLLAAVVEAQVDGHDDGPGHDCGDGDEVLQPGEGDVGARGEGEEAETNKERGEGNGDPLHNEKRERLTPETSLKKSLVKDCY